MTRTPKFRTVAEILADANTPAWIKEGVARLRKTEPVYATFLEAMHDYRVAASANAR
jgi:hypothetical protein